MSHKLLTRIGIVTMIVAIILMLYTFYMFLWPYRTVEVKVQPYPILTPIVRVGELVKFEVDYCKYSNAPMTYQSNFIDSIIYLGNTGTAGLPIGCHKVIVSNPVPNIPEGKYYIEIINNYEVNKLRTITKRFRTDFFEIIP